MHSYFIFIMSLSLSILFCLLNFENISASETQNQILEMKALAGLFRKQPCTTVLYDLEASRVQGLITHFETVPKEERLPRFVVGNKSSLNIKGLKKASLCWIGVAALEQNLTIQNMLANTRKRRIVLIGDAVVGRNGVNFTLQKHHHPSTLIQPLKALNAISIEVKCHDGSTNRLGLVQNADSHFMTLPDRQTLDRVCNKGNHALFGKHITASIFSLPPFFTINGSKKIRGIVINIFTTLAKYFNFDYNILVRSNWFLLFSNGTIGESVLNFQADVSLEQHRAFGLAFGDMTTFTYMEKSYFMELKPFPSSVSQNILVTFDIYTWLLMVSSLIFVSFFLFGILHITYKDIFFLAFGVMFQEYHTYNLKGKPRTFKMLRFVWVSVTLLLVMSFSATLKSSLVRRNFEKPTLTLDEMIDKDMVVHTSSTFLEWAASPQGQLQPINRRLRCQAIKKDSIYVTSNDMNGQISSLLLEHGGATNNFQYSIEVLKGKYLRNATDFPFAVIPERYRVMSYGMLFRKYDPRVEYFNLPLSYLKDSGIVDYFFRRELPYMGMKEHVELKEEKLILEHFYLPLILFLVGTLFSCLVFSVNFIKRKLTKSLPKYRISQGEVILVTLYR